MRDRASLDGISLLLLRVTPLLLILAAMLMALLAIAPRNCQAMALADCADCDQSFSKKTSKPVLWF